MSAELNAPAASRSRWRLAAEVLTRPHPLTARVVVPAVAMMLLVPGYLIIPGLTRDRMLHQPGLALDHLVPLWPAWAVIYISYIITPFLPVFVIRQEELLRRTFLAWLLVWLTGYASFLVYPTILPRPVGEVGTGFFAWFLRGVYDADAPRNCFPSLHVATVVVAALAIGRVHRSMGVAVGIWAALIALSTLFTKQHYVADVITGTLLAVAACAICFRNCPRVELSENDHRAAPVLVLGAIGIYGLVVVGLWVAYRIG